MIKLSEKESKEGLKICKYCGAKFIPSHTATVKEICHPCIMASL